VNKQQKTQLDDVGARLNVITEELEALLDDESEKLENLGEHFFGSPSYTAIEDGTNWLEDAIDGIDLAMDSLGQFVEM
jgi:hypothetical protein